MILDIIFILGNGRSAAKIVSDNNTVQRLDKVRSYPRILPEISTNASVRFEKLIIMMYKRKVHYII